MGFCPDGMLTVSPPRRRGRTPGAGVPLRSPRLVPQQGCHRERQCGAQRVDLFDAETGDSLTLIQNSNSECQILKYLLIFKRKNLEEGGHPGTDS